MAESVDGGIIMINTHKLFIFHNIFVYNPLLHSLSNLFTLAEPATEAIRIKNKEMFSIPMQKCFAVNESESESRGM